MSNKLYYGDNLDVLRKYVRDDTVDLCYIDPPFNSKRNYNQIYNNQGTEDVAQAQAFVDTWKWDDHANKALAEIQGRPGILSAQAIELIGGLQKVLGQSSLLAYLVSMTLRVAEIRRVLKPTGSFYLHCDPTASHYLKLVLDSIFVAGGGEFLNEIVWCYTGPSAAKRNFPRKHDTILCYSKSTEHVFYRDAVKIPYSKSFLSRRQSAEGRAGIFAGKYERETGEMESYKEGKTPEDWWTDIPSGGQMSRKERLGYPTQKPEALLKRIIQASTKEGDLVLDAYCGCGTTVAVAQALKRRWIGIDITYQSIAVVLQRLEQHFGKEVSESVILDGIPHDMASAHALAHKKDDRVRKEFEKWAVLTYTNNRAIPNDSKGADKGIDGRAYFQTSSTDTAKIVFQVKSGGVERGNVSTLRGDMIREGAALGILITLGPPTEPMVSEAKGAGQYYHDLMGRNYDVIEIVTVQEMLEQQKRLDIPMSLDVLMQAQRKTGAQQLALLEE